MFSRLTRVGLSRPEPDVPQHGMTVVVSLSSTALPRMIDPPLIRDPVDRPIHQPPPESAALEYITEDVPREDELQAYGRFWRRLAAMGIDLGVMAVSTVLVGILLVVLLVAEGAGLGLDQETGAVVVGVILVGLLVLYEPLLVSQTGGTIGHHVLNLRVVSDEQGEEHLPFRWALVRSFVKGFVGLPSFILMAVTGRSQAFHDIVTGSTVQIKDIERAKENHYTLDRPAHEVSDVSRPRRIGITLCYLAGLAGLSTAANAVIPGDAPLLNGALTVLLPVLGGLAVYLGWDGRLPGAKSDER